MVWTGGSQGNLAPSLIAMFDEADDRWPFRSRASDGSLGDTDHASRASDHNPKDPNPPGWVDAGDLTYDPEQGVDHFVLAEQIRLRRDPRVKYVIFFAHIFKSYEDSAGRPAWEWQPYSEPNAHKQHMHVSVTPEGRVGRALWFPPVAQPAPPSPIEEGEMFVMRKVEDGTIALGGPGLWRELNGEQSGVAHAICKAKDAIPANARQFDVARDLCLSSKIDVDGLVRSIAALSDDLTVDEVKAAVKAALREGSD